MRLPKRLEVLIALVSLLVIGPVSAQVSEVRIAQQFGVAYLPLIVMKRERLIERHAERAGVTGLKVSWNQFGSGADMNTALIAGALDFASGGVGPVLQIWGRTRENIAVRGVASLGSLPLHLNTANPTIRSLKDFTDKDKIALPAVKVSIQAVLLQMAAAREFGDAAFDRLDKLTVSMRHPDATAALLSGTEVTANFSASPFQEQQLQDGKVRRLLSSYEIVGGPHTLNALYATTKFRNDNPKVYAAVVAALREAMSIINRDKLAAARVYVEEERSKLTVDFVHRVIAAGEVDFTTTPQGFGRFAEFMNRTGSLKVRPESWRDAFFGEVHRESGS